MRTAFIILSLVSATVGAVLSLIDHNYTNAAGFGTAVFYLASLLP